METFQAGDRPARGYLAVPADASGPRPAVLVLHAWWGLTEVFMGVCDRLAGAGFVALAPDLYDGPTAATVAGAEQLMAASDGPRSRAIALAALDMLRAHPAAQAGPVGVIGFSMGAAWAIQLSTARPDVIGLVVLFYGTAGPHDFTGARAAYLGHYADQDQFEPLADVRELEEWIRAAGREVSFYIYPNTGHWFFEENRPDAYDADAAQLAWERTTSFLQRTLGGTC